MYNVSMNIKELIYKKLKEITKHKFNDSSDIYNIGIDSLDLIELVTDAEEELKVTLTDKELESIKTVGDVIKIFKSKK